MIAQANITRFMRVQGIPDYATLLRRSVEEIRWFWDAALRDLGVEWYTPYTQVLDDSGGFPWVRWFVGGKINIVHNCLDRHIAAGRGAVPALLWTGDTGDDRMLTYRQLSEAVCRLANGLRSLEVGVGDAVGLFMPMIPEVVVAMLACQKIGAIPIPIFSGYGADAVAVRLQDACVTVVLTADGGTRKGKLTPIKATIDQIAARVPSLRHVVVLQRGLGDVTWHAERDRWWHELVADQPSTCETVVLPAEATSLIIYTSGTTGRPKGCVHTHAGALAQMAKELGYNFDVKPGDRFFWMTDIGWMMGPWEIIGGLHHGATLVLCEGVPNWPQPDRLWRVCERFRATHLGISPTAIRVLMQAEGHWVDACDLSHLRILGSTGEPWDPESYRWFFEKVGGQRCPVINISGGTEIVGCHLAPLPIHPLKACTLQGPGLGMDVDVFNEAGQSVRGEIGYLVCKQPAPSMTKGFLNDRERYLETYFGKWPGVWNHGDWAMVDDEGYWFLRGRADDTIKVAGKRVGPAEIEAVLIGHPDVAEAAAIGVPDEIKGEAIVCFVVLTNHAQQHPDRGLPRLLQSLVANALGKSMQPQAVHVIPALPKTRSAKIVRGAIKRKWLGEPLGDLSTIENPQVLDGIRGE
ncbi:MAG: AMP-binding protein [Deltaproteobacteria bacterium]|nr:AMP-binding protein [Deltaproteobacteria bacterium]